MKAACGGGAAAHGWANTTFSSAPRTFTAIPYRPPSHTEGLSYAYTLLFRSSSPKSAATTEEAINDGGHPVASASVDHGPSEGQEKAIPKLPTATASSATLLMSQLQLQQQQKHEEEGEEGDEEEVNITVRKCHEITSTLSRPVTFFLILLLVYYIGNSCACLLSSIWAFQSI